MEHRFPFPPVRLVRDYTRFVSEVEHIVFDLQPIRSMVEQLPNHSLLAVYVTDDHLHLTAISGRKNSPIKWNIGMSFVPADKNSRAIVMFDVDKDIKERKRHILVSDVLFAKSVESDHFIFNADYSLLDGDKEVLRWLLV